MADYACVLVVWFPGKIPPILFFPVSGRMAACPDPGSSSGYSPLAAFPMMRILVACEFSGVVRDAFIQGGHEAYSCDLLPSERPGPHIRGDVLDHLEDGWDLMVAHPPCTYLARSGARWWKARQLEQQNAVDFVLKLAAAPIGKIAIENPIGVLSSRYRKPDCIYQPWWFGEPETKATCLWLTGLPPLLATRMGWGREQRIFNLSPSPDRWKERSRTLTGVADAMALQWGVLA